LTRQAARGGKKQLYGAQNRIGIYAGQYYDQETGLHYNYHRYYDPSLGRYLRADPIGLDGGSNPYTYVLNDPVNWFDPDGLARKGNKGDGSASGKNTSNPYKHCKQHPSKPNMLQCKDKNGKKKDVPKPPWWDDNNDKKEMCGEKCRKVLRVVRDTVTGVLTIITIIICSQTPATS
jgi:RHS repeat-associated protein